MGIRRGVLPALAALGVFSAPAWAQNCGSGGGTTVCLKAATTSNGQVQLSWTTSGSSVTRVELYRDTDPDAKGRSRIAVTAPTASAYNDASATSGSSYWYWVKFSNAAGSFNSGAAPVMAGSACVPSTVTPYMNVNGTSSWTVRASAALNTGSRVVLGPQPFDGSWSWSGCGASGSSREQSLRLTASCAATAVFTNSCGARTPQAYNFTVWPAPAAGAGKFIVVDQFGYLPNLRKIAVLRSPGQRLRRRADLHARQHAAGGELGHRCGRRTAARRSRGRTARPTHRRATGPGPSTSAPSPRRAPTRSSTPSATSVRRASRSATTSTATC